MPSRFALVALALIATVCFSSGLPSAAVRRQQPPARYLFSWSGDEDRQDSDFMAVIDLKRDGDRYGTVVATARVGEKGLWPHHTEHELGPGKRLFANGFSSNRNFLFDLHDPLRPTVVRRFDGVKDLSFLHSFVRLPNGQMLATFQGHGGNNHSPGGIAVFDESGRRAVTFGRRPVSGSDHVAAL